MLVVFPTSLCEVLVFPLCTWPPPRSPPVLLAQHCHTTLSHNVAKHNSDTRSSFTHNSVTYNCFTHNCFTHTTLSCTHNSCTHMHTHTHLFHIQHVHTPHFHVQLLHTTGPPASPLFFLPFPSHFHTCLKLLEEVDMWGCYPVL